jgi:CBS domain containing-hemolysin-like protein
MGWLILAAVVLIAFAGLCAAADTALVRVSRSGVRELGTSAEEPSTPLEVALEDVRTYIAVLLLARVAAEVSATVLVAAVLVHYLGYAWHAFLISAAVMTVAVYFGAVLVPRILGRQHALRVAESAASVMQPVIRLLGPVPGRLLRRTDDSQNGPSDEEEDLRGLVDLLERRQVIEPGERAMIHSVFELGDTFVREVMVPRTDMIFVASTKTLRQALTLALRSGFSRIPVVGENLDDVVGIAYLKDIVTSTYEHSDGLVTETVASIMRPAAFVPDSKPVDDLLREMQARRNHVAIVIDEYGGTAGLVTIEDILEEIVGEIADEYDTERPPVEWLGKDKARVTARLSVDELAELFGVKIEAEDVDTVGGLLAQQLGRVPIAGSTATVAGLKLTAEILAGRRNRISTVTVRRVKRKDGAAEAADAQEAQETQVEQDHGDRPEGESGRGQEGSRRRGAVGGGTVDQSQNGQLSGDPAAETQNEPDDASMDADRPDRGRTGVDARREGGDHE